VSILSTVEFYIGEIREWWGRRHRYLGDGVWEDAGPVVAPAGTGKMDQAYWLSRAVAAPGHAQHYKLSAVLIYMTWVSAMLWAKDKLLSDCSGAMIGLFRWVNAKFRRYGDWVDFKTVCGTPRPTAQGIYNTCVHYGTVFNDPFLLRPGDFGFHWNKWLRRHTHVWLNYGHAAPPPWSNSTSYTWEYGDGTGHAAFHTDLRQRLKFGGDAVHYGRLVSDLGDLTPVGGEPTLPPIPFPIAQGCTDGVLVRLVKGIMNQVIPGCSLYTGNTASGISFGPITATWVRKGQALAGLPETGVIDQATMTFWQKRLREKMGP